jgi:hypothetical protein
MEVTVELLAHRQPAAAKAGLDDVDAQFQDLRGLFGGQLLDVPQQNDGSVDGWKLKNEELGYSARLLR